MQDVRWGHPDQWQGRDSAEREAKLRAEVERLREERDEWRGVAARWSCCRAGLVAAPAPCPWHGDGIRATGEQP